MVHRTAFFKFNDNADVDAIVAAARDALPRVVGVISAKAGVPADEHAACWDLYLCITFEHHRDIASYIVDPVHAEFVSTWLAPFIAVKRAWNFEV